MLNKLKKALGLDPNERALKRYREKTEEINLLEEGIKSLSDEELRRKGDEFRSRLAAGETEDDILPEVFAVVGDDLLRTICLRHVYGPLIADAALF